jgi:hypothetical protein
VENGRDQPAASRAMPAAMDRGCSGERRRRRCCGRARRGRRRRCGGDPSRKAAATQCRRLRGCFIDGLGGLWATGVEVRRVQTAASDRWLSRRQRPLIHGACGDRRTPPRAPSRSTARGSSVADKRALRNRFFRLKIKSENHFSREKNS